jgi:DedD protein
VTDTDNLELKKRSRRRLVGAAALALLAAILLPMVMDQEPNLPRQDVQITIPDRDAESLRPIAGRPAVVVDADLPPAPQEQPPATGTVSAAPEGAAPRTEAPRPAPASAASAPTPAPAAAASVPANSPPQDEAARVLAILSGQTPPPAAQAGTSSSFVVQIAAFGEPAKATALSNELKGKGFAAYTEKAGTVTRVRVGPFASRAEADRAAASLRSLGQSPVVTAR